MYWHFIPFTLVPISLFMTLHYRVILYNKKRNTNISWQQYMGKLDSLLLMFPILKNSNNDERQAVIRKVNLWTGLFWIGFFGGLLVAAIEYMP